RSASGLAEMDLSVTGMHCASCVARVERALNHLDDVTAQVNLVSSNAHVVYDRRRVTEEDLVKAIEDAGYGALPKRDEHVADASGLEIDDLDRRIRVVNALGLPSLLVVARKLRFRGWQWVYLAAAVPTVLWGGAPFHRRALKNLRHKTMT